MRYLYLLLCFFCGSVAFAQPSNSATFRIPHVEADNNTEVCIPVTVDNFSSGVEFSFAIQWAPPSSGGALTFTRVQALNPAIDNFDMGDFNIVDYVDIGLITVEWGNYLEGETCDDADGTITLDDGSVLFEVCYQVNGPIASNHPVRFFNKPDDDPFDGADDSVDIIFNKPPQCATGNDAFPGTEDGSVTIGVKPLILGITDVPGIYQPGDTYCVDVVAESGFENLVGYQFGIQFDTLVLRATSRTANTDLAQNFDLRYNLFDGVGFFGSWSVFGSESFTLPNGTPLVTACFEVIGECSDRTDLTVGDIITRNFASFSEASGPDASLRMIPVIGGSTRLIVDNCNPDGFDVIVDCPDVDVNFGDANVCVDIRAGDDFDQMRRFDYLINFDPDVLEFAEITNRNPALGIDIPNEFDFTQAGNGVISFDYTPNGPRTLAEGDVVYSVCFNAVGFGGTSPIVISDFRNNIESDAFNFRAGLNPTNCAITVQQPEGVAVNLPDVGFSSTQDNCFEFTSTGFTDVTEFTIYISLPNALFDYRAFTSSIPGVTGEELAPGSGIVRIVYPGPTPITIPEGDPIGSVCFRAQDDAAPADCTPLALSTILPSQVATTESGGNSVNVASIDGEACVLFPNGFGLILDDTEGFINDEVCVPVSVTRFTDVTQVATSFNFDPSRLTFSNVVLTGTNWPGLTTADFVDTGSGRLDLNWSSASPGGTFIADADTVQVFEICFMTRSEDRCSDIFASDAAMPATRTAAGPGSIVYGDGEICLEDRLIINSITVIPASCEDSNDGGIMFDIEPRPNNEDIIIRASNVNGRVRFGNNGLVTDLPPGQTDYILYNNGSTVRMEGQVTIGVNPDNAAVADAGNDGQLSCGEGGRANISGRNNVGEEWNLFIVQPSGMGTRLVDEGDVGDDGNVFTSVMDPGTYILEVISEAGCANRDTVIIAPATNPIAVANDGSLDCNDGGMMLSGEGSSEPIDGIAVTYLWERITIAGEPIDTPGMTRDVMIDSAGLYRLTVSFPTLGCSTTDQARVTDDNNQPNSILPTEAALNCDGSPLMLTTGPLEDDVIYTWTNSSGSIISGNNTFTTSELGTYVVNLTNQVTGCSRVDTVEVVESRGIPVLPTEQNIGSINCTPDTTQITLAFEGVGPDTRYRWSTVGGRIVITDLNAMSPRVTLPGTYKVVVTNGVCRDSAEYIVAEPVLPMNIDAGEDATLDCREDFQLAGSADGDNLEFQWTLDGMPVPMGAAASVVVNQPGTYLLEATNSSTGCSAVDSMTLSPPNGFPRYMLADTIGGLGCEGTSVRLAVTGEGVGSFDITWTAPDGTPAGSGDDIRATEEGVYLVEITNPGSGCTSSDSVRVIADAAVSPFVSFRQNTLDITCETGPALIDASGSSQGPGFTFTWEAVVDGEEPNLQGNDTLRVRTAGTYRLTIVNPANQCSGSREMTVTDSRVFPQVVAVEGSTLDCDNRMTSIGVDILDQPNDYQIQWSGPTCVVEDLPVDTTQIAITCGGTYNAVVINPETSCVTTVSIRVEDLIDSIATLAIMEPDSFDCNNETITIDASASELNDADPSNIVWTSFDGNTITPATGSLVVSVNGPGDYELSIVDASGCTVRDTVAVFAAENTPFAQAGEDQEIECGDTPQLDGTGSSPGPLPGILYFWSVVEGDSEILPGQENSTSPSVTGPGVYQLVVTNLANGCADTSLTTVSLSQQTAADAGGDRTSCDPTVVVTGNQPDGTFGVWTAFNDDGSVWTADRNVATVTEIADGLSLVWTLSAGMGCENYSADTVRVGPEEAPIANPDFLIVGGNDNIGTVDLTANDQRDGPVTVTLLGTPEFGEILADLNGQITFEAPLGTTATTTIDYEICSTVCPGLCDRSTLTIQSDASGTDPVVYNAITPNGDGMNDLFVFDILNFRPDDFPDNEITIFNRWGDVIYEAAPYNNDWDGTGVSGTLVPEGTYYYILRLNVGEGEIIRGDVTVIR